jgi:hypothetical protein
VSTKVLQTYLYYILLYLTVRPFITKSIMTVFFFQIKTKNCINNNCLTHFHIVITIYIFNYNSRNIPRRSLLTDIGHLYKTIIGSQVFLYSLIFILRSKTCCSACVRRSWIYHEKLRLSIFTLCKGDTTLNKASN